jgi:hypothetical protein
MAGGLIAQIGGIANDRSRGVMDRLKKGRQNQVAKNVQGLKSGTRYSEGGRFQRYTGINRLKRGVNFAGERATTSGFGMTRKGREKLDQKRRNNMADLMKTPGFQAIQEDDDALRAATYRSAAEARQGVYAHNMQVARDNIQEQVADGTITTRAQYQQAMREADNSARRDTERAVAAAQASVGFGRPQAIAAAQQMVTTGTGYRNLDDMTETMARAAGGNASTGAGMAGFANFMAKQKGRHDLAPGANNAINDTLARMGANDAQGARTQLNDHRQQIQEAWNSGSLYSVANGKTPATRNFANHIRDIASARDANGAPVAQDRYNAAIALKEMQNMLPSASGANQVVINRLMRDMGVDFNSTVPVDDQIIAATQANITAAELNGRARVYDREEARLRQNNP